LIKLFADKEKIEEIRQKYLDWWYGYWHAKLELLNIILEHFKIPRERFETFRKNPDLIYEKINLGNEIAKKIVNNKYNKLKDIVWL
jgi:tryptophanyl-tRNA synthetase